MQPASHSHSSFP
ncbi:hypothetical protein GMOD_00001078 [Pyrenophora seminiperda CCB06]|uniref:Uncharacterized protein n=1 Tax=Pyrenophora seminiperda CCB06 TaxID=1302712 RepID=A0A3M7LYD4_9PLEO|nr:hypothetical protein GMOD_00001078 [Pyrenophora seminiperda CCB06]